MLSFQIKDMEFTGISSIIQDGGQRIPFNQNISRVKLDTKNL
jgi:hypothetical protein